VFPARYKPNVYILTQTNFRLQRLIREFRKSSAFSVKLSSACSDLTSACLSRRPDLITSLGITLHSSIQLCLPWPRTRVTAGSQNLTSLIYVAVRVEERDRHGVPR
jgi:hypothetical protein